MPTRYYFQLEPDTAQPFLFWRLSLYDFDANRYTLYEGAPVPSWDCQSDLSLPLTTPPGLPVPPTLCSNWPAAVTLTPVTQAVGGASGSGTLQAVCTCAVCAFGTYQEWGIDLAGFPSEAGIDGAYNLAYQGECTWYLLNSNGTSIQLQLTAEQAILEVTVLGTAVSSYPPALTVTGIGLCECASGSSSSSSSSSGGLASQGSVRGSGGSTGSNSNGQSGTIATTCCPGVLLPTTLYLNITNSTIAALNGSWPLVWNSVSDTWFQSNTIPLGGFSYLQFFASCGGGSWNIGINCSGTGYGFYGFASPGTFTCLPLQASGTVTISSFNPPPCAPNGTTFDWLLYD